MIGLVLLLGIGTASASQQAINYFGTEHGTGTRGGEFSSIGDIAVNGTGAGPAGEGDIYVLDNNRIQRFGQDDSGTPSNPYDDTYPFLGAWGAGVDSTLAGSGYEICTIAANCNAGTNSGASGALTGPINAIAVDQDTGVVYVSDGGNYRINSYEGDGTFLRSFGWDVVEAGPDDVGTGFEICVAAKGDACKAGNPGAGIGQMGDGRGIAVSQPDGNAATGTVFLADRGNRRINTYALDGSGPGDFGSAANFADNALEFVAVDSRGIVYAADLSNHSEVDRYDSSNVNGGGVGFLAPISSPPLSTTNDQHKGLEVDPDTDGAGPDTDMLYVVRDGSEGTTVVQQFGPANAPGLVAPPSAEDDEHGLVGGFNFVNGLGLDIVGGSLFLSTPFNIGGKWTGGKDDKTGVYVLGPAGGMPTASLDSVSDVSATAATIHATVDPNGAPPVTYRLEYSLDGVNWISTPEVAVGSQESPQPVVAQLDPPPLGLEPATLYHVRLVATKAFTPSITTSEATFTTSVTPPQVETTGSPLHTTTTARLEGRVLPGGAATTFNFEYGQEGPCDANSCLSTGSEAVGSGNVSEMVSASVADLEPGVTYHYRVVADNGQAGSPVYGEDMTVTTRSGEAPLSHGHFPGPPGSDRAWELVSASDSGGNPVAEGNTISDDGTRAVWELGGGSPLSETGGFNQFYSERTASGWQTNKVYPTRNQLPGPNWHAPLGPSDLSSFFALNLNFTGGGFALFRMSPGSPAVKLHEVSKEAEYGFFDVVSDDGSRALMATTTSADPEHAVSPNTVNLFDVTSGTPHLVNFLPGNVIAKCGLSVGGFSPYIMGAGGAPRDSHWLSADGELAFFLSTGNSCAETELYMRDLDTAETKLISAPALSGVSCGAGFIRSTTEAAFFWTKTRLAPEDTAPRICSDESVDGDVYRYDLGDDSLQCVTCVVPGAGANVFVGNSQPLRKIAVASDGSRVYFESASRLLPGARIPGVYRVNVETGDLAYLGATGAEKIGAQSAMTPDGSDLFFSSNDPSLNPLGGGPGNAGTKQLYRYDDNDRSLVCVSCPQDGSAPRGDTSGSGGGGTAPNTGAISEDGIFAFTTPTALVGADQNTAGPGQDPKRGTDAYEWRNGRLFLVTDGLANRVGKEAVPIVMGITPSGHDLIFTATSQYTADALDDFKRLYDARIGGGIDFPKSPPPCPLEVCQGTPKGAPEEAAPGTGSFAGPANLAPPHKKRRAHHKKHSPKKHSTRQTRKHAKHRANHDRRIAR